MIIVPEAENHFIIQAETVAEVFLLKQFISNWMNADAKILMTIGHMKLEITNKPVLLLSSGETLEQKIKKRFL